MERSTTDAMNQDHRKRLKEKLEACVRLGRVKLSSGKVTDFYFDGRLVTLDPEGSVLIAELMLEEVVARGIQAVGGLTSGADPLTSAIGVLAHQRGVPLRLFFVRKVKKVHGMEKRIEGPPLEHPGDVVRPTVALVDDVLTTGGSLLVARDALVEETGLRPGVALVIVDREEGGKERLAADGIEVVPLFRKADFLPGDGRESGSPEN